MTAHLHYSERRLNLTFNPVEVCSRIIFLMLQEDHHMKQSGRLVIAACAALVVVSGCASPKPPTPTPTPTPTAFNIEVKADKPVYKVGEFIYLTVRATQECFLSVYDISTLGEVTQIFRIVLPSITKFRETFFIAFRRIPTVLISPSMDLPARSAFGLSARNKMSTCSKTSS